IRLHNVIAALRSVLSVVVGGSGIRHSVATEYFAHHRSERVLLAALLEGVRRKVNSIDKLSLIDRCLIDYFLCLRLRRVQIGYVLAVDFGSPLHASKPMTRKVVLKAPVNTQPTRMPFALRQTRLHEAFFIPYVEELTGKLIPFTEQPSVAQSRG